MSLFIGCFEEEQSNRCHVCTLENSGQLVGHGSLSVHGGLLGEFKDRVQASKQYYEKNDVGGFVGSVDATKNVVCDTPKKLGIQLRSVIVIYSLIEIEDDTFNESRFFPH